MPRQRCARARARYVRERGGEGGSSLRAGNSLDGSCIWLVLGLELAGAGVEPALGSRTAIPVNARHWGAHLGHR